jgi:hypothetical protein
MCQFFSFVTDDKGNKYYFNYEQRKTVCKDNSYEPDSHTSIADYYGFKREKEDLLNKYEYDPFNKKLTEDTITFLEDRDKVLEWCNKLDFNTIDPKIEKSLTLVGKRVKIKISPNKETVYTRDGVTNKEIGFVERVVYKKNGVELVIYWPESFGHNWRGVLNEVKFIDDKNQNIFTKFISKMFKGA